MKNFLIADSENLHIIGLKHTLKKFAKTAKLTVVNSKEDLLINLERQQFDYLIIDPNNIFLFYEDDFKFLKTKFPSCKIIILSHFKNKQTVNCFLKEKIDGFIFKDCREQTIFDALYKIENDERYLCPKILNDLVDVLVLPDSDVIEKLTCREYEILRQIVKGNDPKVIATELFISIYTFRTHRKNIMKKIGVHTTCELILFALDNKIV
ncbi:MAG TPA: response regulator transcription factor [Flavobacterium sp.]|nr:response regulator transcription factor [Flavobacterium sp.]